MSQKLVRNANAWAPSQICRIGVAAPRNLGSHKLPKWFPGMTQVQKHYPGTQNQQCALPLHVRHVRHLDNTYNKLRGISISELLGLGI